MSPQMEALEMLNNMFQSFDGRPVDQATLTRTGYAFLVQALTQRTYYHSAELERELALANARIDYLCSPDSSQPEGSAHECKAAETIEYAITLLEVNGGNPKVIEYLRAGLDQHKPQGEKS